MTTTVFSARKLNSTRVRAPKKDVSLLEDNSSSFSSGPHQPVTHHQQQQNETLTKTDNYLVSKLSNFPVALEDIELSRGSIDFPFAAVIGNNTIHIWNYSDVNSSTSITLSFPYEANSYGLKPFVVLVPNEETPSDPGLVIVDSFTGDLKYYESISNAPALKVLNFKILELQLRLHNEFITLVEYIPDIGVFIATSTKKVLLVTLKDNLNKPQLNKIDVISSSSSFNFLSSIFNDSSKTYNLHNFNLNNNRIATIKEVHQSALDGSKRIVIQDSDCNFEIWDFNKSAITNRFRKNLKTALCSFLSDIYDNIQFSFKILDLICLKEIAEDVFLILTSFNKDETDSKNLVLFTAKITKDDVLIYSTYKLTCYSAKPQDVPKLILPKPYNTCYIIVNNSVILAEVITSLDPLKLAQLNYRTKWEDIITFKSNVDIVGFGYEDEDNKKKSGLLVVTSNSGLLKIENVQQRLSSQFEDGMDVDEAELNLKLQQEPMLFIKSHIEQAIYFGNTVNQSSDDNPLLFQVPKNDAFNLKDIEAAILSVLNEMISNNSKYLPKVYPSVGDFLKKRTQIASALSEFILNHFKELSVDLKILILNLLNKFKIADVFYTLIKDDQRALALAKSIFPHDDQEDPIRDFFFNYLTQLPTVLYEFIRQNKDDSKNLELVSAIGESYLEFEKNFRYDKLALDNDYDVYTDNKPFLVEDEHLLLQIVSFYNSVYDDKETLTLEQKEQLVSVSEFLFYAFNDTLSYTRASNLQILSTLLFETYEVDKYKWIENLTAFNLGALVLRISELFEDMSSIVEVLTLEEAELSQVQHYFDKFGYQFASAYYKYLITHRFFKKLFLEETCSFLNKFFHDNKQYNHFYWIYLIQSGDYGDATTTLLGLEDDLITNKQFNLSLAKLTAVQEDSIDEALIPGINHQLKLAQYQLDIEPDDDNKISLRIIDKLRARKVLSVTELIDALSLTKSEINFHRAYTIIMGLEDKADELKLLFTRLLMVDDWDFLNDINKTDEYLTSRIKSTVTYKTIYLITQVSNDNLDLNINKLLDKSSIQEERIEGGHAALSQIDEELIELDKKYQLNDWVQSIISLSQDV